MNKLRNNIPIVLSVIIFIILIFGFEIMPLITVVMNSFQNDQGTKFSLQQYMNAVTNPFYAQSIKNSIIISLKCSFVAIIIATLGAYSITKLSYKTKEKVLMLSNMTSNFVGVPLAFAFIIILGNNGLFTLLLKRFGMDISHSFNIYSIAGLNIVYIYFQIPLGILFMYPAFDAIKEEWKEAAAMLGASYLDFWRHIGVFVLLPSIIGTFNIMIANAMGAYATAVALTSGSINILPIRIGTLISGDLSTNPMQASALAVILTVILVIINLINTSIVKKGASSI